MGWSFKKDKKNIEYLILLDYIVSLSSQKIEIKVDPEKYRPVDNPYICCDNSKIKEHFKGTDLKQTIKEMYEYYLNN